MKSIRVPLLGPRYWAALCIASVFGANMGDFFPKDLGLGHVNGLPILAFLFGCVFLIEKKDKYLHQAYYWISINLVRTAVTNLADFAAGDLGLSRSGVMADLALLLILTVRFARMYTVKPIPETNPKTLNWLNP